MDATIVIDEPVSRELTKHNMVAKWAGFNQQRKNTLPTTTLRNVHYAYTWACPTSSGLGLQYMSTLLGMEFIIVLQKVRKQGIRFLDKRTC